METKDNVNNSNSNFFKPKGILFLIIFLILILSAFVFLFLRPKNQSSQEHHSELKTTTDYSIEKVVCYSSAYGINKEETQARWDLNLSQYTDIAIYLNSQPNISSLVFDGSLLKRGKVTLSSLKNTVSFTIHLIDTSGQEFTYPIEVSIPLENKETGETIYSGSYIEENFLTDAYFYVENQ